MGGRFSDLYRLFLDKEVDFGNRFEVDEGLEMQLSGQITLDSKEVLTADIIQTNKRRLALPGAFVVGTQCIFNELINAVGIQRSIK